jgi:hypothetical protein
MKPLRIVFTLEDRSRGYAVTPQRVPLAWLREFASEVEEFLRGDSREVDTAQADVTIAEGSLEIAAAGIVAAPRLQADLKSLQTSQLLDDLEPRRRKVVETWQRRSRQDTGRAYLISTGARQRARISAESDFHADDANRWVQTERYVRGEIVDMGGKTTPNVHVVLADGSSVKVDADKLLLAREESNRLYKPALLRIRARYNLVTREYRDASLIEFVEYAPRFTDADEARLTERGAAAWKGVDDAAAWVEEQRGNE